MMRIHAIQCGCHGHGLGQGQYHEQGGERFFLTKDEKIKRLVEYKDWLDNEMKGVEETIQELKKE